MLEAREVVAEIEPGVTYRFMTYSGQVPGPMIRVRQGDTVNLTLRNPADSSQAHNVDLHAVMGPGGSALATRAQPGEEAQVRFKVTYPGAFNEQPSYVLINGARDALTAKAYGPMKVTTGETARVFFVCGGPNLGSSFHPIANVWREVWPQGALRNAPLRDIQTQPVPPGRPRRRRRLGRLDLFDADAAVPEAQRRTGAGDGRVDSGARPGAAAEPAVRARPAPQAAPASSLNCATSCCSCAASPRIASAVAASCSDAAALCWVRPLS